MLYQLSDLTSLRNVCINLQIDVLKDRYFKSPIISKAEITECLVQISNFKSIFKVGIYSSIKLTLIQTNYLQSIVYTKIEKIVFIISDIFYRCIYLLSNL